MIIQTRNWDGAQEMVMTTEQDLKARRKDKRD